MFKTKLGHPRFNKIDESWILYFITFSVILTPQIKIQGFPYVRLEHLISITFLVYVSIKYGLKSYENAFNKRFVAQLSGMVIVIVFSIIVGSIKGIAIVLRDFFEIYKVISYLSIYLAIAYISNKMNKKEKALRFIVIFLLVSVVIAIQQYFDLFNLNIKYVPYIAPSQYHNLINNPRYPRSLGITTNPNEYAIFTGIGFLISWSLFLKYKEIKQIIFMVLFLIAGLMTLSRSGFVFLILCFITYTLKYVIDNSLSKGYDRKKIARSILLTLLSITVLGLVIFFALPDDLTWRILVGLNISKDNSFQLRLQNWQEHIEIIKLSPLFGVGPGKSIPFEHHVDNEWIYLVRRYGILGTVYLLSTFVLPMLRAPKGLYKNIYYSILIGAAIYMIPAHIFHSFQLMSLVLIVLALVPIKQQVTELDSKDGETHD